MATVGLKSIWGLEQLDRTGIATWKLGVLLIGGGVFLAGILLAIVAKQDQASHLGLNAEAIEGGIVFTAAIIGAYLFVTFSFSRATEADLEVLMSVDNQVEGSIKLLIPSKSALLIFVAVGLLGVAIMIGPLIEINFGQLTEAGGAIREASHRTMILYFLLLPLLGIVSGPLLCTFFMQSRSLIDVARQIEIDSNLAR